MTNFLYFIFYIVKLLQGLSLPNNDARSTAAQVVGQIGVIELRNNEWNDLISIMITACKGDSYILKEGTLNALGILCEDIVGFNIDIIFSVLFFLN